MFKGNNTEVSQLISKKKDNDVKQITTPLCMSEK